MLKDATSLPVLKNAVDSLKRMRNGLSRLLLLDVDLLKTLGRPDPKKYGKRSLNTFLRDPPSKQVHDKDFYLCVMRRLCIFLVEWPFFNNLILVLILVNGVLLAMVDPLESYSTAASSQRHIDLSNTLAAMSILFALELLITFIAYGVYYAGPNSHLRNNWNKCDALKDPPTSSRHHPIPNAARHDHTRDQDCAHPLSHPLPFNDSAHRVGGDIGAALGRHHPPPLFSPGLWPPLRSHAPRLWSGAHVHPPGLPLPWTLSLPSVVCLCSPGLRVCVCMSVCCLCLCVHGLQQSVHAA